MEADYNIIENNYQTFFDNGYNSLKKQAKHTVWLVIASFIK